MWTEKIVRKDKKAKYVNDVYLRHLLLLKNQPHCGGVSPNFDHDQTNANERFVYVPCMFSASYLMLNALARKFADREMYFDRREMNIFQISIYCVFVSPVFVGPFAKSYVNFLCSLRGNFSTVSFVCVAWIYNMEAYSMTMTMQMS